MILLAEDEPFIRMEIAEVLTTAGFEVVGAKHAAAALIILAARAIEVRAVFTDIQMPGVMDGLALAHYVSGQWPWIGLLITSGNATPTAREMPLASRFVPKPYQPGLVVHQLRTLVNAKAKSGGCEGSHGPLPHGP